MIIDLEQRLVASMLPLKYGSRGDKAWCYRDGKLEHIYSTWSPPLIPWAVFAESFDGRK